MEMELTTETAEIYTRAMRTLDEAGIPYIVAGAIALHYYTGFWRNTKDLDLFLRPQDRDAALLALANAGFRVEITAPHWLAKGFADDVLVDLITGMGNWLATVDDSWLAAAEPATVLGVRTRVIAASDLIWAKAYVAGRERFDGADICHIIFRAADRIDWRCLLERFGPHWELLLTYLHLFRFVYPEARDHVPTWLMEELLDRASADLRQPQPPDYPFRGPLLDRYSFLVDLSEWGEPDPREEVAREQDRSIDDVIAERAADRARLQQEQV